MSQGARGCVSFVATLLVGAVGCGSNTHAIGTDIENDAGYPHPGVDSGPGPATCVPTSTSETQCGDGIDNDCNGFVDCLDPACEGQSCGGDLTCQSGGCLKPCTADAGTCLRPLPKIDNVHVTMRGDTAIVEFEPVENALDYRIYPMPDPNDLLVGSDGTVTIRNAIYRCAGGRPFVRREYSQSGQFDRSLAGSVHNYTRTESESILGYVYLTPGAGRQPVYQVSNPNLVGGYAWDWGAPPGTDFTGAEYMTSSDVRARLISQGWRDDGIAFYVPTDGTRPIYRRQYLPATGTASIVVFYTDGPEFTARAQDKPTDVADFGERFRVLAAPVDGAVALHRVLYGFANDHDVLAAGEARFQRVLHQGNLPIPSLTWPGLPGKTSLVIEALDAGCPFPGGYIGPVHAASTGTNNAPTILLDEARLPSGEVFVNGEYTPTNRPKPIARAFVDVTPQPEPPMDWFEGFSPNAPWEPAPLLAMNGNGNFIYRNSKFSAEFAGCTKNHSFGPVLGQLVLGGGDWGSSCNMHIAARGVDARVAADHYLHVRMSSDIPSTMRRYPQLMITTVKLADIPPGVDPSNPGIDVNVAPVASRLGPMPFQMLPPGTDQTIVVQPFGSAHELQIEFCDQRGWGVSQQCARANIYGFHAGDYTETWQETWRPVPVLGEEAGWDRPVRFDVYASTQRVYVFVDDKPGGCALLPANRMPAAPVTVLFGSVGYHMDIDESVVPANSPHEYLRTYSQNHIDRHMDDFGIDLNAPQPAWDESVLPCGTRWYGASK